MARRTSLVESSAGKSLEVRNQSLALKLLIELLSSVSGLSSVQPAELTTCVDTSLHFQSGGKRSRTEIGGIYNTKPNSCFSGLKHKMNFSNDQKGSRDMSRLDQQRSWPRWPRRLRLNTIRHRPHPAGHIFNFSRTATTKKPSTMNIKTMKIT